MCGRFTLRTAAETIAAEFDLFDLPAIEPRYNIAPTQGILAVLPMPGTGRQTTNFYWGLIPSWAKHPSVGTRMINARAETIAEKPAFRTAYRQRRCLIPADGYYEWTTEGKRKQPHYVCRVDGQPFAFAGLWEEWHGDRTIRSCTIITTCVNERLARFHDRMPVIVASRDYETWLTGQADQRAGILGPAPNDLLTTYPVDGQVNNVRNDSPECIEPVEENPTQGWLIPDGDRCPPGPV